MSNSKSLRKAYAYLEGPPLALIESGQTRFLHAAPLGTPERLTDASGRVVWSASYDPFGRATVRNDPDGNGQAVTLNLRFPGQYFDAETGLHYNYFRDYDPATGRYIRSGCDRVIPTEANHAGALQEAIRQEQECVAKAAKLCGNCVP